MTNYEKILTELQNMSIKDFAKTRVHYDDNWGCFFGDFSRPADEYDIAIKLEIEWLNKQVEDKQC